MPIEDHSRVLRIAPHLRHHWHGPSGTHFLVGEREHYVLRRAEVGIVLGAIDGSRDVDELLASLADKIDPLRSLHILQQLFDQGLLTEVDEQTPEPELAFCAGLRLDCTANSVALCEDGTLGPDGTLDAVAAALRGAGLQLADTAQVVVLVTSEGLSTHCETALLSLQRTKRACFLLQPSGLRPLLGPFFPALASQPCPACFLSARREQRPVETYLSRARDDQPQRAGPVAAIPASVQAASGLAAVLLKKQLAATPAQTAAPPTLWALDLADMTLLPHRVRARPQCPHCGDPTKMAQQGQRVIELAGPPIRCAEDGGFRTESPEASQARLAPFVSSLLGPVTHLVPMPGQHSESHPVYSSGFHRVPSRPDEPGPFDRPCAGKGITAAQAKMSALAEAIERYAGLYRGDEACQIATLAELGDAAVSPCALHRFGGTPARGKEQPPPPLPPEVPIGWTPGYSLTHKTRRYLPLPYCYADAPAGLGAAFCRPSSNGCAAGNTLAEAILQGLFEAVERDAIAIWWYGRLPRPPVTVPADCLDWLVSQRAQLLQQQVSLWTLDVTHDVGLPVVVAVAVHEPTDRLWLGFGCHASLRLALRRAVSEVHQVIDPQGRRHSPWDGLAAQSLPYLFPHPQALPAKAEPLLDSSDLQAHIELWVAKLAARGLEVIVVDKTRPDIPLHVAQVIVPGLRHAWPRLGPGRLYDVPVQLGWLPERLREDELNPHPLLI